MFRVTFYVTNTALLVASTDGVLLYTVLMTVRWKEKERERDGRNNEHELCREDCNLAIRAYSVEEDVPSSCFAQTDTAPLRV